MLTRNPVQLSLYSPFQELDVQEDKVQVRDSLNLLARNTYFAHLFISFIYTFIMLAFEPKIRSAFTFALLLLIVYGFLLVWVLIFNVICLAIKNYHVLVFGNRVVIKIILVLFPFFAAYVFLGDHYIIERSIITFLLYYLFVTLLLIVYMIYCCTCGSCEHDDEMNEIDEELPYHSIIRQFG